jgi:hypothetical protein
LLAQVHYIKNNYQIVGLLFREPLEKKSCQGEYFDLSGRKWKNKLVKLVEWKAASFLLFNK